MVTAKIAPEAPETGTDPSVPVAKKAAPAPLSKPAAPKAAAPKAAAPKAAAPKAAEKPKPVAKSAAKAATAPPAPTPATAASVEAAKPKKPKLVRDSFTIPKAEYQVLEELKLRAADLKNPSKKSELLRAGIKALAAMDGAAFLAALRAVPAIKTGRPGKS